MAPPRGTDDEQLCNCERGTHEQMCKFERGTHGLSAERLDGERVVGGLPHAVVHRQLHVRGVGSCGQLRRDFESGLEQKLERSRSRAVAGGSEANDRVVVGIEDGYRDGR